MARRPPATRARPCCGRINPASTLRSVVLPAPLGPKIASVCPGASVNDTPSSATTRPYVCRSPSAESIDARGEIFHVERLDQVARMAQVEHVDERLHADVRCRDDHGEGGPGLANLLQQRHTVGIGETQIEHQHLGPEVLQLAAGFAAARGERYVITGGEEPLVGTAQRRFILDEQHPARRTRGRAGRGWTRGSWGAARTFSLGCVDIAIKSSTVGSK